MKKNIFLFFFFLTNLFSYERVAVLSPSLNEIVFALNSGEKIVANTLYSNFPEESKKILKVGGYNSISLEKILFSKPDLVLLQDYDKKLITNLNKLGLNAHFFKTNNIEDIINTITKVGKLLNKEQRANFLVKQINENLQSLQNIVENKTFMIVISPNTDLSKTIYIAGNDLYFSDILRASGNSNVYSSKSNSQPVVNMEKIINLNPDVVVILAPYLKEQNIKKEDLISSWEKLPIKASFKKDIYIIDKEYAGIPSNRVVNFMNDFKKILVDVRDK